MQPVSDPIWMRQIAELLLRVLPKSKEDSNYIQPGETLQFHYAANLLERLCYIDTDGKMITGSDQTAKPSAKVRWDDAYHILLHCLEEARLITYSPQKRDTIVAYAESFGIPEDALDPEIDTTTWVEISPSEHCSNALVRPDILPTLEGIGLVASGHWTEASMPILWRKWSNQNPTGRPADTQMFQNCLDQHYAAMPAKIADEFEEYLTISEDLLERKYQLMGRWDAKKEVWHMAGQARMMDLEWLLSQNWRYTEGWLSPDQKAECLFFGFDQLASEMTHAIVMKIYPDSDVGRLLSSPVEVRANIQ